MLTDISDEFRAVGFLGVVKLAGIVIALWALMVGVLAL